MPSKFVLNEKHKNINDAKSSLLQNKIQTTFNTGVASSQPKFRGKILIFKKNNSKNIPPNLHNKIMNKNYGTMYAVNENIKLNSNGLINSSCYEVINRNNYNKIKFMKQNKKTPLSRRSTARSTARPTTRPTSRSTTRPTARSSTRPSSSTHSSSRPSSSTRSSSRSLTTKSYKPSKKRGKKFSPVLNNIKEGSNERNSSSRNSSSRNSSENSNRILGAKPSMKKKILNILNKNKFKNKNNYSYKNLVEEHKSLSLLKLSQLAKQKIKVSSNYLPKSLYNKLNQYQNGKISNIQFKRQLLSYILDIPVNEKCLSNNKISN